jgi:hypothetical protein
MVYATIGSEEADDVAYRAEWMLEHNEVPSEFAAIF